MSILELEAIRLLRIGLSGWENDKILLDKDRRRTIRPKYASIIIQKKSQSIMQSFNVLGDILGRYEATIRKRWAKKNQTQRRSILLQAWPDMAKASRPDLKADRARSCDGSIVTDIFLWPNINLEDLSSGNHLLRFLNSRGRHHPANFALLDINSIHIGVHIGAVPLIDIPYTFMTLESDASKAYGTLITYQDGLQINVFDNNTLSAGDGLRVLQIQERILDFLNSVCAIILGDKDLANSPDPLVPEPDALQDSKNEWLSAASAAQAAPYEAPRRINLDRITDIIVARVAQAQDHLWSLREDPGYFAEYMNDWAEHSFEAVHIRKKKKQSGLSDVSMVLSSWDPDPRAALYCTYRDIMLWRVIDQLLHQIIKLLGDDSDSIKQDEILFDPVRQLTFMIDFILGFALLRDASAAMAASPPMRSSFKINMDGKSDEDRFSYDRSGKDDLIWMWEMLSYKDCVNLYGLEPLALEAEKLLRDKAVKRRITAKVAQSFSDIGIMGALQNQLRMVFPRLYDKAKCDGWRQQDGLGQWMEELLGPMREITRIMDQERGPQCLFGNDELCNPVPRTFFYYPVHKPRTRANTEALQAAERRLDAFWNGIDDWIEKNLSETARNYFRDMIPGNLQLFRTPDWAEPEQQAEKEIQNTAQGLSKPFLTAKDDQEPTNYTITKAVIPKEKMKTRGIPNPAVIEPFVNERSEQENDKVEIICHVKKRAYKVFSTLFYQPNEQDHPGEIVWKDFVHAMNAIGFEPEKLYGSVWQFTPLSAVEGIVKRPISFHEPHPSDKIPFNMARRYGRRLAHTYGLDGSCFTLQ
ncbi:hypothetical protein F4777DRAFT_576806 [Nemania sp. FL0916]|nr:hypothetical protein F4777DRAFT_576806 [Nemania sp. FL0916]